MQEYDVTIEDINPSGYNKKWPHTKPPRMIKWFKPGTDKRHRIGGPAVTNEFTSPRGYFYEAYFVDGKDHREDGPACNWYDFKGGPEIHDGMYSPMYFLEGEKYTTKEHWQSELNRRAWIKNAKEILAAAGGNADAIVDSYFTRDLVKILANNNTNLKYEPLT